MAQIAILLVLARRAAMAGARFAWGTLQETEAPLSPGAGADACRRLIEARTPHEATAVQIDGWRLRLEERPEWDEVWVIGSPRLGAPPDLPGALHLQLWDTLDLDARQVGVSCARGERHEETRLDLPDDAVCVRLMRLGGGLRRTEERDLIGPAAGARAGESERGDRGGLSGIGTAGTTGWIARTRRSRPRRTARPTLRRSRCASAALRASPPPSTG